VALSLSLAKYFRRKKATQKTCFILNDFILPGQKYWAKDVVILYTQHEQLGVQAWLEAYHQVSCGKGILQHGDLKGRAGAIQVSSVPIC
jgi:Gaa1-like, GPI transamidase component